MRQPVRLDAMMVLGSLLAMLVLALPSLVAAHRAAPPRCPTARPTDGQSCRSTGMTCSYRETHEGALHTVCRCSHTENGLRWACHGEGPILAD